jgi:hypothetical protein
MPLDFFEKELGKVQLRFNQTFGVMPLCNPKTRTMAILAIVQMGILQKKIMRNKKKEDISRFVKIKDLLNKVYAILMKESERRQHGVRNKNQKPESYDSGNEGSGYGSLPGLQNYIQPRNTKTG